MSARFRLAAISKQLSFASKSLFGAPVQARNLASMSQTPSAACKGIWEIRGAEDANSNSQAVTPQLSSAKATYVYRLDDLSKTQTDKWFQKEKGSFKTIDGLKTCKSSSRAWRHAFSQPAPNTHGHRD
jgi:hypothetical protein